MKAIRRKSSEVEVKLQDKLKNGPGYDFNATAAPLHGGFDGPVHHDLKAQEGGPVLVSWNAIQSLVCDDDTPSLCGDHMVAIPPRLHSQNNRCSNMARCGSGDADGGDFNAVSKELQDRVYWLMRSLWRFKLEHVPSVVTQNGPLMKV